ILVIRFAQGLRKIWLDGRVRASLEYSVAQVGAPQAWQAGFDGSGVKVAVLDTGVDERHPDLAGRIAETRNFTSAPSVRDRYGHGTHVASIVASQGTASEGRRKGAAPGAELMIGKVLGDDGFGTESQIIEGMEWAAGAGADVVNMSLSGDPTDGTDPLSVAVDALTESTGSLFVVSAGNDGLDYSVGTPGTAASALTVGAVDRNDALAGFSNRGPRLDGAPKPDITAPGVGIVAARSEGTALGTVIDANYTSLSGTSMATPHVAGAAAILKQKHPSWKARQIKDALVATAETVAGQTVYEQGGGRLDVARAVRQGVTATGALDLGTHHPGDPAQTGRVLAYANGTGAAVRLDLSVKLAALDGGKDPGGAVTLGATSVTVEPGATAEVPLSIDVAELDDGRYGGYVTATSPDGTVALHTTLSLSKRGHVRKVRFTAVGRDGRPVAVPALTMYGITPLDDVRRSIDEDEAERGVTVEVTEGAYMTQAVMDVTRGSHPVDSVVVMPELKVTSDMDVVLDAREAAPITIETPKPAVRSGVLSYFTHRTLGGRTISQGVLGSPSVESLAVTPTEPVTQGAFEFVSRWQLAAPKVSGVLKGTGRAVPMSLLAMSPPLDGRHAWPLADGAGATPEEISRMRLRGRALVVASERPSDREDAIAAAAAAGAEAVIVVGPPGAPVGQDWSPAGDRHPLPVIGVAHDDGRALWAPARTGRAVLTVTGVPSSPYLYDVMQVSEGHVPERVVHEVNDRTAARVDTAYHEAGGFGWAREQRFGWRPWQGYALGAQLELQRITPTPARRAEYVSVGGQWQHIVTHLFDWDEPMPLSGGLSEPPRTYRAGERVKEGWFGPVVRPAVPATTPELAPFRAGDTLAIAVPEFVDSSGHYGFPGDDADTTSARFYRDGRLVEERPYAWGDFPAVPGEAEYRLELSTRRTSQEWAHAIATDTAWTFRSARPQAQVQPLPLLQVDYDVPADLDGRVPRGLPVTLGFAVRGTAPGAAVKSLTAELSYDDGTTWRRLPVLPAGRAGYAAPVAHPAKARVSLRVTATDTAGNQVRQTVVRAYGVR
ncbi:S8 family peptidase, partial [Sphaerisporangium dianthi]